MGWYEAHILITPKSSSTPPIGGSSQKIFKFGVGDVFVIAGQSNAQGYQAEFDSGLLNYYTGISDTNLPDAGRIIGQAERNYNRPYDPANNLSDFAEVLNRTSLPFSKGFEKLTLSKPLVSQNTFLPTHPNTVIFDRPIFPYGVASWCWAPLAIKYVSTHNVPVAFYNVAESNTSITKWQKGQENYNRLLDIIINQANITGFRGVLWHQGERDAADNMPQSNYQSNLQNLVNDIQNDYDPQGSDFQPINWYISRVSHFGQDSTTGNALTNSNIINAQTNSSFQYSVKKDGIFSDVIPASDRGPDQKIHFHDTSLNTAADLWNTKLTSLSANIKAPMQQIGDLTFTDLGSSLRLTRVNNFPIDAIKWVKNEDGIISPIGTGNFIDVPKFSSIKESYTAYVKPQGEKYYVITSPFIVPNSQDKYPTLIINGDSYSISSTSVNQTKKVFFKANNLCSWNASLPGASPWVTISGPSSGSSGDQELTLHFSANNGSTMRSTQLTISGSDCNGTTISKGISLNQIGVSSSDVPLTSQTLISASAGWNSQNISYSGLNIGGSNMHINGVEYENGIGTHAESNIIFNIDPGYQYFHGKVGRDDAAGGCGCNYDVGGANQDLQEIIFKVKLNGVLLWTSGSHTPNTPAEDFNINLGGTGGNLELIVDKKSVNWGDWANWVNPFLSGTSSGSNNIPEPINSISNPSTIANPGDESVLSATCNTGIVTWSTGVTGSPISVYPTVTTNYTVKCVSGSQESVPRTVTVTVATNSCSVLSDHLVMGTWNVTGHQLISRAFHNAFWLVQKINIHGSQYDEFVVRAGEMLARNDNGYNDITLASSNYNSLPECYALDYSGYGGLVGPNNNNVPFPAPLGYSLYYTSDQTPYYSNYNTSSGAITNGGCYRIKSVANNKYLQAIGSDFNEYHSGNTGNDKIWKFTTSDNTNWKIKSASGDGKYLYAEGMYCGARVKRTSNTSQANQLWQFDQNGNDFRFFLPNGTTWDHEGASTLNNLQVCGDNTQGYQTWRLVSLEGVSCPSGVRVGNAEAGRIEEVELPLLTIAPNPTDGLIHVSLNANQEGPAVLNLLDITGKIYLEHSLIARKGLNQFDIDATWASPGTYLLQAITGDKTGSQRVVIE